MDVKEIQNPGEWDEFVAAQEPTSILQSSAWYKLSEMEGQKPSAFFVAERGEILAAALVTVTTLPLGRFYIYSPRGPIFKTGLPPELKEKSLAALAAYLRSRYKTAIFFRIDPAFNSQDLNLHKAGFRKASRDVQPPQTVIVDLRADEGALQSQMKPKTRYNLKLAEKRGVHVLIAKNENDIRSFYRLLKETSVRNNFHLHSEGHYLNIWRSLQPGFVKVYLAELNGQIIAGIMVTFFGETAVYLHGGTDYQNRAAMAPYLLHFQAMKDAKLNNLKHYDFWGVAPEGAGDEHPWAGIGRFKLGFGGKYYEYMGSRDFIFNDLWYRIFNTVRNFARLIR